MVGKCPEAPSVKLSELGIRAAVSLPNADIELISVVDQIKAAGI